MRRISIGRGADGMADFDGGERMLKYDSRSAEVK